MRQNDLAFTGRPGQCHLGLFALCRQCADVSRRTAVILGFTATHAYDCTDDGFLVCRRKSLAGENDTGKDESWVGIVGSDRRLSSLLNGRADPRWLDNGQHHGHGFVVLGKVNGCGNNVCAIDKRERAIVIRFEDSAAVSFDRIFQLLVGPASVTTLHGAFVLLTVVTIEGDNS